MVTKSELRKQLQTERMIEILDSHMADYMCDHDGQIRVVNCWPVDNGRDVKRYVENGEYRTEQVVETIRDIWQALGY